MAHPLFDVQKNKKQAPNKYFAAGQNVDCVKGEFRKNKLTKNLKFKKNMRKIISFFALFFK